MKKIILAVMTIVVLCNTITYAQNNEQEAILTYQLAQDEYDKGHLDNALKYLDKVDNLEPSAKMKTTYLRTKIYKQQIDQLSELHLNDTYINDSIYFQYKNAISCYIAYGQDEEKKTELLKAKINLEIDPYFQKLVTINKMTKEDLKKLLEEKMNKNIYYEENADSVFLVFYCNAISYFYIQYSYHIPGVGNIGKTVICDFPLKENTFTNSNLFVDFVGQKTTYTGTIDELDCWIKNNKKREITMRKELAAYLKSGIMDFTIKKSGCYPKSIKGYYSSLKDDSYHYDHVAKIFPIDKYNKDKELILMALRRYKTLVKCE